MGEIGEYFSDLKAHRKRRKLANPPKRRCWDWMVVSGDTHYARNRSSFNTYRKINPGTYGSPGVRVIGVGTVELQVRRAPDQSDTRTLVLENVLHVPDAMCNGFNSRLLLGSESWSRDGVQGFDKVTREPSWYGREFCGLNRLVLAGNPQGESPLQEREEGSLMLSMYLSDEDIETLHG